MSEANWYVVHTYSGYENKVKANIEKTIENRHLEEQILEVRVPMQDVVEMKDGQSRQVCWSRVETSSAYRRRDEAAWNPCGRRTDGLRGRRQHRRHRRRMEGYGRSHPGDQ